MGFQSRDSSLVDLTGLGDHRIQEMCFYKIHEYLFVTTGAPSVADFSWHYTFLNTHMFIGLLSLTYVNGKHTDIGKCSDQ